MKEKLRGIGGHDVLTNSVDKSQREGGNSTKTRPDNSWTTRSAVNGSIGSRQERVGDQPGPADGRNGVDLVLEESGTVGRDSSKVDRDSSQIGKGSANKMAATVNSRKFPSEPEEDIAAIAKQISDHAEAIYQNWKSRGLAPTEILSCNNVMPEKFTASLTSPKKSVDILGANPNNLEQLVNNFVVEDKARIAREMNSPTKNLSSIQYAKQKFENKDTTVTEDVLRVYPKSPSFPNTKNETFSQYIMDTIETTLPVDVSAPSAPTSSGMQTWPLKNKPEVTPKPKLRPKNEFIDEVAKEEERLINALKTGTTVVDDAPSNKPNILQKKVGLTAQRPGPAVEPKPMGIVKKVVKSYQEQMKDTVDYTQSGKKIVRPSRRYSEGAVPHPDHKQGARAAPGNPVRPFLTRGSVAERVLIFEKCPPAELSLDKRKPGPSVSH